MSDDIIVSKQDANQVLRLAYDDAAKALRVTGGTSGAQEVVQPDGTLLHVTVDASALPTGAATQATLSTLSNKSAGSDVTVAYDYRAFTKIPSGNGAGQIGTIVYRLGGASGTVVATQTIAYDSAGDVSSITKT